MKINRNSLHYDLQFFNSIKNPYFLQWHFQSSIIIYMLFQHWSTKNTFKPLFRKYSRISFLIYNTIGLIKKEYNRIYRLLRFTFRKLETTAFIVEWSNMKYGATIFNSKNYPSKSPFYENSYNCNWEYDKQISGYYWCKHLNFHHHQRIFKLVPLKKTDIVRVLSVKSLKWF